MVDVHCNSPEQAQQIRPPWRQLEFKRRFFELHVRHLLGGLKHLMLEKDKSVFLYTLSIKVNCNS